MKSTIKLIPFIVILCLLGCDNMNHTDRNVLGGAAIGAVGGALIGRSVGGAAIGAGVGAVGGYVYDRSVYRDY